MEVYQFWALLAGRQTLNGIFKRPVAFFGTEGSFGFVCVLGPFKISESLICIWLQLRLKFSRSHLKISILTVSIPHKKSWWAFGPEQKTFSPPPFPPRRHSHGALPPPALPPQNPLPLPSIFKKKPAPPATSSNAILPFPPPRNRKK